MTSLDIVDLSSDDEKADPGHVDVKPIKLELDIDRVSMLLHQKNQALLLSDHKRSKSQSRRQESDENRSSKGFSTGQITSSMLDQERSSPDDTGLSSVSPFCPAPLCRQFWKAGNYDNIACPKVSVQSNSNYLHVHPMFLHSNATSHKWAFGAIAELLDNAIDEIQNGATFVNVDKTLNPRDGSTALLIQDDGGGMDPEGMRRCMSFGFSDKKSKSAIGQYGNGFKTSTMRLGADVIVFSRNLDERIMTQSIGLLSYSFLTHTGHDRIIVPIVDYRFNPSNRKLEVIHGRARHTSNLSLLLQWSPYSTEAELLKQFNDIGSHGTKVIIYNLWYNNDGNMEIDFNANPEDICIDGDTRKIDARPAWKEMNENHIANRFRFSLREYLSILFLRVPDNFSIILRGRIVEHHNIATDLKFPEFILYKPQVGGTVEGKVITTIGFLKEAPHVSIHGFNVYHKNRLILPFWQVVSYSDSRGRGVVGVLEANFVEPTHNKQDFERTSLFQKLETRLKEMTWEYWDHHCGLIGYQVRKKPQGHVDALGAQASMLNQGSPAIHTTKGANPRAEQSNSKSRSGPGIGMKRKGYDEVIESRKAKTMFGKGADIINEGNHQDLQYYTSTAGNQPKNQEAANLLEENKKLQVKCLEYGKRNEELNVQATRLRSEIKEVEKEYSRLLAELEYLDSVKDEKNV